MHQKLYFAKIYPKSIKTDLKSNHVLIIVLIDIVSIYD